MVHSAPSITDSFSENDGAETITRQLTPTHKAVRSDVHFSLSTPRRCRAPQMTQTVGDTMTSPVVLREDHKLSVRTRISSLQTPLLEVPEDGNNKKSTKHAFTSEKKIHCLPHEIQGFILDYIFGDMHSIIANSSSLQSASRNISSSMRHPRRKAISSLALVSSNWRELVQERIYRHSECICGCFLACGN